MTVLVWKYGHITRVSVDNNVIYSSANAVKPEAEHITELLKALNIENIEVKIQ